MKKISMFLLFFIFVSIVYTPTRRTAECVTIVILPIADNEFNKVALSENGTPPDKCADFNIILDPMQGKCLTVGNWNTGIYTARWEYKKPIMFLQGTVYGYYKTDFDEPNQACVRVSWMRDNTRIIKMDRLLPSTRDWTPFKIVFRNIPPGNPNNIRVGFGLTHFQKKKVYFTRLSVTNDTPNDTITRPALEITRQCPPKSLPASKRYSVVYDNSSWWMSTPEGKPFFSLGVPTFNPTSWNQAYWIVDELHRLRFNSIAAWTPVTPWRTINDELEIQNRKPLPFFYCIQAGGLPMTFSRLIDANGSGSQEEHAFPDPFDPNFEVEYRKRVKWVLSLIGEKSWFIGWFADNEVDFYNIHRKVYTPYCSQKLKEFLVAKYRDISNLNNAWSASFSSFDDLIAKKPDPIIREGQMFEDFWDFILIVIKEWAQLCLRILREEDPGRLVFSNRFNVGGYSDCSNKEVLEIFKIYDGLGVNLYPNNQEPGMGLHNLQAIELVYKHTGKPIILSEWSVPSVDSGLYDSQLLLEESFCVSTQTQQQRAWHAANTAMDYYNLPYIVGLHWFIWYDFYNSERHANRGLYKYDGVTPWVELQDELTRVNNSIIEALEGKGCVVAPSPTAKLEFSGWLDKSQCHPGDIVKITLKAFNNGDLPLDINLALNVPAKCGIVSSKPKCQSSTNGAIFPSVHLDVGQTSFFEIWVKTSEQVNSFQNTQTFTANATIQGLSPIQKILNVLVVPKSQPSKPIILVTYPKKAKTNEQVQLDLIISEGYKPYRICISWGDKTNIQSRETDNSKSNFWHVYQFQGTHQLHIVVSDAYGQSVSITKEIEIF
jgi:hypothetical protein